MEITSKTQGDLYFFANGTGYLPLVDMLDTWFRWAAISDLSSQGINAENEWNSTYEFSLFPGFRQKLCLFLSFECYQEFIGSDFVERLANMRSGAVKLYLRFAKPGYSLSSRLESPNIMVVSQKFDLPFIQSNVESTGTRYYICGSPEFSHEIPKYLAQAGVTSNKIRLL